MEPFNLNLCLNGQTLTVNTLVEMSRALSGGWGSCESTSYTDGREGSHSVTLCRPVGGGVVDVETVMVGEAKIYAEKGYYKCDQQPGGVTGYCTNQQIDTTHPNGLDCMPSPTPVVLSASIAPAPVAQTVAKPAAPQTLPAVGMSDLSVVISLVLAVIAGSVKAWRAAR